MHILKTLPCRERREREIDVPMKGPLANYHPRAHALGCDEGVIAYFAVGEPKFGDSKIQRKEGGHKEQTGIVQQVLHDSPQQYYTTHEYML